MQTTTSRQLLLGALDMVGLAITKSKRKYSLPILKHFRLQSENEIARVTATNLDQMIEVQISAEGTLDTSLDWKTVRDFLAKAKDHSVTMTMIPAKEFVPSTDTTPAEKGSPAYVRVVCGDQSMNAPFLTPQEMPEPHIMKDAIVFSLSAAELQRALRLTGYAQSIDDSRYVLNGIFLEHLHAKKAHAEEYIDFEGKRSIRKVPKRPQSAHMIATDGRRLAMAEIDRSGFPADKEISAIIPSAVIAMLGKIKRLPETLKFEYQTPREEKPSGAKEPVKYKSFLRINFGDSQLTTELVDGQYPNYKQVIPQGHRFELDVDRDKLIDAIDAAKIKGCDESIRLDFCNHVLTVEQKTKESGSSSGRTTYYGKLPTNEDGNERPMHISFNPVFLKEAVKSLISPRVKLRLVDELTPILIAGPSDGEQSIVIMPMRTA